MKKALLILAAIVIISLPLIIYFMNQDSQEIIVEKFTKATIETTKGTMVAELYPESAPETVMNFGLLAKEGKYNGVPFHRVIENFMIQTGDFEYQIGTGGHSYKGPGTKFKDEFAGNLSHVRGALSMANAGPNTNGSQFFIVHAPDTAFLDGKHSVFGKVTEGLDVLDAIATTPTGAFDKPIDPILINTITVE